MIQQKINPGNILDSQILDSQRIALAATTREFRIPRKVQALLISGTLVAAAATAAVNYSAQQLAVQPLRISEPASIGTSVAPFRQQVAVPAADAPVAPAAAAPAPVAAPAPAPAAPAGPAPAPAPAPAAPAEPAAALAAPAEPAAAPAPVAAAPAAASAAPADPAPAVRTIYVAGSGDQSMVDMCIGPIHFTPTDAYSLFITEHDFCGGWARFSGIGVGETVSIPGYGTYTVTGRGQVPQGGTTNNVAAVFGGFPRAILQTCIPGTNQMLLIALN